MKTETFKDAKAETAYGQTLPTPVLYSGSYEAFSDYDEIVAANEIPSNDEILTFVNNKRKASARQKALVEALDAAGYKKPTLEDPQVQLRTMANVLVKSGKSETEARSIAETVLGIKFA